jgi:hypothetical protein
MDEVNSEQITHTHTHTHTHMHIHTYIKTEGNVNRQKIGK